jgi:adenosine deaminase
LDWLRRGLKVSLNTDDPALFHTSLAGEFEAQLGLGATRAEVLEFLWRALESCWLPADERRRLAVRCAARLAELEVPASTTPAGPKAPAGSDLASA